MIRALGFSQTADFKPFHPGRLCRGRERWIAPWKLEEGEESPMLTRLVITGAAFDDDSARDAFRGLSAAGVDPTELIDALFPGSTLLAFTEDGHPADIPDAAEGIELYDGHRAGGKIKLPLVRWHAKISDADELFILSDDVARERISGFALLDKKTDVDALVDLLFGLVGMSTLDSPPARYNPAAMPDLLEHTRAILILHRDKHGPVLGVYSREPIEGAVDRLTEFAVQSDLLLVPFAIPPMLARWDRALYELRRDWNVDELGEFPVPRAETPSHWESRRNRRKRQREEKQAASKDDGSEE